MLKAIAAEVKFGYKSIEGLMTTDGVYGVAVSQVANLFGIPVKNAKREFKNKLGIDKFQKWESDLHPKAVKVLTLEQFNNLIPLLASDGNKLALDFLMDVQGLALYQLFCDASGEKEERQESKIKRASFTEHVELLMDGGFFGDFDESETHRTCARLTKALNKGLFGKSTKQLCKEKGAPRNKLRDYMTAEELEKISIVETYATCLLLGGDYKPMEAMKEALVRYRIG